MGEVRTARDTRIDREVAVKLMHEATDDKGTARFLREARVQGALDHPVIVPVHDLGIDPGGHPYFVMKRLAGTTLHDVLAASGSGKWPKRTLLARLVDIALAVDFAHARGVVHRDLKPANIMLGDYGEAYVLDWGLARIVDDAEGIRDVGAISGSSGDTVVGDLLGTPGYMSPEQARGDTVDQRTDVFSLGCVLFEILVGRSAMPRGLAALEVTLSAPCHRPSASDATADLHDIAPELDDLCARATAQDAGLRPTARAFGVAIQAYLDGDRDRDRRRALADDHANRARIAFAGAPTDESRATTMREAGRAIALDPDNTTAQEILARALFVAPEQPPAGAIAAADHERGRIRQKLLRFAAAGFLAMTLVCPVMFSFEVHYVWPIIVLMIALAGCAWGSYVSSFKVESMRPPLFPLVLVFMWAALTMLGLIFGPLFLLPTFLTGSLAAWLVMPIAYRSWIIVAMHVMTIVPLVGLELAGLAPTTFHTEGHRLVLESWVLDLTPVVIGVIWTIALVAQTASSINIMLAFRQAFVDAQNARHAQAWHLKQLLPRSSDHGRSLAER